MQRVAVVFFAFLLLLQLSYGFEAVAGVVKDISTPFSQITNSDVSNLQLSGLSSAEISSWATAGLTSALLADQFARQRTATPNVNIYNQVKAITALAIQKQVSVKYPLLVYLNAFVFMITNHTYSLQDIKTYLSVTIVTPSSTLFYHTLNTLIQTTSTLRRRA